MQTAPSSFTARHLLRLFLEFWCMSPDMTLWKEAKLADNLPRLVRLRQLMALFRAFKIDWNPAAFVQGKFIDGRSSRHQAFMDSALASMRPIDVGGIDAERRMLPVCFKLLFEYRARMESALSFSRSLQEGCGLYLFACRKADEMNGIILQNIGIIEDCLAALISPERREFALVDLVRDHGYPAVDLSEIDADWC